MPTEESIDQLLFTKFRDRKYEEEWRNWFKFDEREDGHYFYYFGNEKLLELPEVIAGPLCDVTKGEIEIALGSASNHINIVKARLAFKTFRIVRNRKGFQR